MYLIDKKNGAFTSVIKQLDEIFKKNKADKRSGFIQKLFITTTLSNPHIKSKEDPQQKITLQRNLLQIYFDTFEWYLMVEYQTNPQKKFEEKFSPKFACARTTLERAIIGAHLTIFPDDNSPDKNIDELTNDVLPRYKQRFYTRLLTELPTLNITLTRALRLAREHNYPLNPDHMQAALEHKNVNANDLASYHLSSFFHSKSKKKLEALQLLCAGFAQFVCAQYQDNSERLNQLQQFYSLGRETFKNNQKLTNNFIICFTNTNIQTKQLELNNSNAEVTFSSQPRTEYPNDLTTEELNTLYTQNLISFPETEPEIRQCLDDYINGADQVYVFLDATSPGYFTNREIWKNLLIEFIEKTFTEQKPHYEEFLKFLTNKFGNENHLSPQAMQTIRERAITQETYRPILLELYAKNLAALPLTTKELNNLFHHPEFLQSPNAVFSFLKESLTQIKNCWQDTEKLDDTLWQLYKEHHDTQILIMLATVNPSYPAIQTHISNLRQSIKTSAERGLLSEEECKFWELYDYNAIPLPITLDELQLCLDDYALEVKSGYQFSMTYKYLKTFFSNPSNERTLLLTNLSDEDIETLFIDNMQKQANNAAAYLKLLKLLKPEWWQASSNAASKTKWWNKGKAKRDSNKVTTTRSQRLETTAKDLQDNARVAEKNKALDNKDNSKTKEAKFTYPDARPEEFKSLDNKKGKPTYITDDILPGRVMYDPVTAPTGGDEDPVFDREVIEAWIDLHGTHPYTRAPLTRENLIPENDLQSTIDRWAQKNGLEVSRSTYLTIAPAIYDDPKPSAPPYITSDNTSSTQSNTEEGDAGDDEASSDEDTNNTEQTKTNPSPA